MVEALRQMMSFPLSFATVVLIFFVLVTWQHMLIPMVIAVVVWYILVTLAGSFKRIPLVGAYLPSFITYIGALSVIITIAYFMMTLVRSNISTLIDVAPNYQERLSALFQQGFAFVGLSKPPDLSEIFERFDLVALSTGLAGMLRDIAENAGIIGIYVIFLLLEQHSFEGKLQALFPEAHKQNSVRELVFKIGSQVQTYLRLKMLTSLLTAITSYLVLVWVGVDFADFWALLIFLLNFIPTLGSIVATVFPCSLALVQFDTFAPAIIVSLALISIQILVGNILEPKWMGRTFNLSGLVIIISLAVWGQVWGIVGMFLCVPFMVITNIILANFPQTRSIAILLSSDGQLR